MSTLINNVSEKAFVVTVKYVSTVVFCECTLNLVNSLTGVMDVYT